jgi:hypothetical protein
VATAGIDALCTEPGSRCLRGGMGQHRCRTTEGESWRPGKSKAGGGRSSARPWEERTQPPKPVRGRTRSAGTQNSGGPPPFTSSSGRGQGIPKNRLRLSHFRQSNRPAQRRPETTCQLPTETASIAAHTESESAAMPWPLHQTKPKVVFGHFT